MSNHQRHLKFNSVGRGGGVINLWMVPLWLKGDKLVVALLSPREARKIALRLLEAADAEDPS